MVGTSTKIWACVCALCKGLYAHQGAIDTQFVPNFGSIRNWWVRRGIVFHIVIRGYYKYLFIGV